MREIDASLSVTEIERRLADSRYEKEKIAMVETLYNWKDVFKLRPDLKLTFELEETKRKCEKDIAEILLKNKLLLKQLNRNII